MAPLAPKPHLLNVPDAGNNLRNDHGGTVVPNTQIPATAVHLFLVATLTF